MSSSRLYVLMLLERHGPMHGHRMRLAAQQDRLDLWTDVRPGALYGVLKRLAGEGLIAATASERAGAYPERTVYEITADGRAALEALQDQALRTVVFPTDPFDLALAGGDLADPSRLRTAPANFAAASALSAAKNTASPSFRPQASRIAAARSGSRLRAMGPRASPPSKVM